VKTGHHVEGSKRRRRKTVAAKHRPRARFIGARPLKFSMILRRQVVDVEVVPVVSTATHVNFEVTISRAGKVLDWVPTRAEQAHIGHTIALLTEQQTSH
jgi:hypothetical protein